MRRNVIPSVVLCGIMAGWLSAGWHVEGAEPSSGQASREGDAPPTLQDPHDYLWLVNHPDPKQLAVDALLHKLRAGGGLLAEEGASVVALVRVGVEISGFAQRGDLIWVVRIVHMWHGVTQEMWISSTTGAIRSVLPYAGKPPR